VRHKNQVLDEWCRKLGREPSSIERTSNIPAGAVSQLKDYAEAGAQRVHLQLDHPFDLSPVEQALKLRV
ncbi:MAG TPA: LLM class F420-dependent oxidoreductase, partial [Chloroflexota bacterium]|nr:LLM class F420-dependent oxidoreductase [Chloroflexota bacterium]